MKQWLLFAAGLLVGVAGGLVLGGYGERGGVRGDGDGGARSGRESHSGERSDLERRGGRDGGERRGTRAGGRRGALSGPAKVDDLVTYLRELARIDDFEEVNFMELLRHGHFVTSLREDEVTALLAGFRDEVIEEDGFGELGEIFQALLFARLSELNGPEAIRMALAGEMGKNFSGDESDLLAIGMASWVGADPEAAAAWFRGGAARDPRFEEILEDGDVQRAFFAAMARHDTRTAMDLIHEAGEDFGGENMEVVARYEESIGGLERMLAETSGNSRQEVFHVMSERDPGAAKRWLEAQGSLAQRDDYVATLGTVMLGKDVEEGVEWYMAQDLSKESQVERYEQIVDRLVMEDEEMAGEWLAGQPDTPLRDSAEASLARLMLSYHEDAAESLRWVGEIGSEGIRHETLQWIFRRSWDNDDREMDGEIVQATREAGFQEDLDAFLAKQRSGEDER